VVLEGTALGIQDVKYFGSDFFEFFRLQFACKVKHDAGFGRKEAISPFTNLSMLHPLQAVPNHASKQLLRLT
jgi:hypothetical protein